VEGVRLRVVIRGRVQGVGFRFYLLRHARGARLRGWVSNRPDGAVELLAEGSRLELDRLLAAAREGPRSALVAGVEVDWSEAVGGLDPFDVAG
jgi:acylphosphatase